MKHDARLLSLAVRFPDRVVDNDHWRRHHPAMVAAAEQHVLGKVWAVGDRPTPSIFEEEMAPYLKDPFRGADRRRWLAEGQTILSLEVAAAREALQRAGVAAADVGLAIVASFAPDQPQVGNAAFLARDLGLTQSAWNLESACSGGLVALRTAAALVDGGLHETVLVVTSCDYSRIVDETDSLAWSVGDGVAAFVVGRGEGARLLGSYATNTAATCGAVFCRQELGQGGGPVIRMRMDKSAGPLLRDTAEPLLLQCTAGALDDAGVRLRDVDFCIFNTPTAWYARFCARALGLEDSRIIDTFADYANTGPVLTPANLFHAALDGLIHEGDLVLCYGVGSVSNACAVLLRWGTVPLGARPAGVASFAASPGEVAS